MKKFSEAITRRSFLEGTGAIAGGLTMLPGSVISGIGTENICKAKMITTPAYNPDKVNAEYSPARGTSTSSFPDKKEPFILKELPDLYKKGYPRVKIGMCQVYSVDIRAWVKENQLIRPEGFLYLAK